MRVLLRKQQGQTYLQPDGKWSENRETARQFEGSVLAYYWALEQQLLGVDILLAFDDERWDVVSMRISPPPGVAV